MKYRLGHDIMDTMKKKLLLIGGGTIATHYKAGLECSPHYELVALSDINPNCASRNLFSVPFYTDYNEALAATGAEVAMIATSTSSHYEIAKNLLGGGISVITEKPICESYDKIEELCALAELKKIDLGCVFHWKYADEVKYLKQHLATLGRIERIAVRVCDDYANTDNGSIRADRRGLCGAWLDSGINILSYIGQLCDLHDYELVHKQHILDKACNQTKFAHCIYRFGTVAADITVDWRTDSREKTSEITCERGLVQVNHTRQTVLFNGMPVYQNPLVDRLSGHYKNAFAEFTPSKEELHYALLLHKILFEGEAQ